MIIETNKTSSIAGNIFESKQSSIDSNNTAKMYRVLTGLYSDIIGSIVREYVSNAVDSTIRANSDEPILIHLSENMFTVQDFGTGISEHDMFNVFINFLTSTKENSNNEIGGWGLGAKCALTYVDSFTIESVFEGTKTSYLYYKNDSGIPDLNKLMSIHTDESNGVKVSIPTLGNSIKFFNSIKSQLYLFSNIYVSTDIFDISNQVDKFNKRSFCETDDIYMKNVETGSLTISIGNVEYPLNKQFIRIPYIFDKILNSVIIKFNIGEIMPTPSRESIEYTDRNIQIIQDRIIEVATSIEEVSKEFYRNDDLRDAHLSITYKGCNMLLIKDSSLCKMVCIDITHREMWRYSNETIKGLVVTTRINKHNHIRSSCFYTGSLKKDMKSFLEKSYPNETIIKLTTGVKRGLISTFNLLRMRSGTYSEISASSGLKFLATHFNTSVVDVDDLANSEEFIAYKETITDSNKITTLPNTRRQYAIFTCTGDYFSDRLVNDLKTPTEMVRIIGKKKVVRLLDKVFSGVLLKNHILIHTTDKNWAELVKSGVKYISLDDYCMSKGYKRVYTRAVMSNIISTSTDTGTWKYTKFFLRDSYYSYQYRSLLINYEHIDKAIVNEYNPLVELLQVLSKLALLQSNRIELRKSDIIAIIAYLRFKKVKTNVNFNLIKSICE